MRPTDDSTSTSASAVSEDSAPEDAVRKDAVADLLADPYTRSLLHCLRDADGEAPLPRLARCVASSVTGQDAEDIDADTSRQVETFLHHGQLPELVRHGVVDYDAEDGRVTLRVSER